MPDYMNAVDYMKAVNELNYNDFPGGGWMVSDLYEGRSGQLLESQP